MEFLDASGESLLREYLQSIIKPAPLEILFHDKLIALLKIYFFTGGMPEAISSYLENENFNDVRQIQRKSHEKDFYEGLL